MGTVPQAKYAVGWHRVIARCAPASYYGDGRWPILEQAGISLPDPLLLRAVEVFGKAKKALSWLNMPNADFSGKPLRIAAQTDEGKAQVLGVLLDLEHGFAA